MKTALFIILPYPSHYNVCFGLASELKKRNFDITYVGPPHLRDHIESQGFNFFAINSYTTEYKVNSLKGFVAFFLKSLLSEDDIKKRYREWYASVLEIQQVLEKVEPDQIFIDAGLSFYYVYLAKYNKPITLLEPTFSTEKLTGVPPIDSTYSPKPTLFSSIYCEFLWAKHFVFMGFCNSKRVVAFLGKNEYYFLRRLCKKQNLQWNNVFGEKNLYHRDIKGIRTIVLAPKNLEFKHTYRSNKTYINLPIARNEEKYFTEEYLSVRTKIEERKNKKYKIAYCAFGTLSASDKDRVTRFVDKLIAATSGQNSWILVVSTGGTNYNYRDDEKTFFLNHVPQLDLLKITDVMITHGGFNSVKECLQQRVPMLVYPLNMKADHPGVATRIQRGGYGLMGEINKDTSLDIIRKLNRVYDMKNSIRWISDDSNYEKYFTSLDKLVARQDHETAK